MEESGQATVGLNAYGPDAIEALPVEGIKDVVDSLWSGSSRRTMAGLQILQRLQSA